MVLRWGIASTGKISHDFAIALSTVCLSHTREIYAVAARDLNRAQEFAKLHKIPNAYGSYEELAKDSQIDVVYVGVINPLHYEVCMLMLDNGKHVLCEKPLGMNEQQVLRLTAHAKEKKLFLMEGIWSRFFPSYKFLKKIILSNGLGEIKKVSVSFGFDLSQVDRAQKKSLGGGALLDIGVYAIQLSQWVFRETPKIIKAKGILNDEGIDVEVDAELQYPNGGITEFKLSSLEQLENSATIEGTKGRIRLDSFWCPTVLIYNHSVTTWTIPEEKETNFKNSVELRHEATEVGECINQRKLESEDMSHQESLLLAHIEDEIRRQIGVKYYEDEIENI